MRDDFIDNSLDAINDVHHDLHGLQKKVSKKITKKSILFFSVIIVIILGVGSLSLAAYGSSQKTIVLPGVHIGKIPVGNMTRPMLVKFFQEMNEKLANEGINLDFDVNNKKNNLTIYPTLVSSDQYINLVSIDPDLAAEQLVNYKKSDNNIILAIAAIESRLTRPKVSINKKNIVIDQKRFSELLVENLGPHETEARDAGINITQISPYKYTIVTSSVGVIFNHNTIHKEIINSWSNLELPEITLTPMVDKPEITEEDVANVADRAEHMLSVGSLDINFEDPQSKENRVWKIGVNDLKEFLEIKKSEEKLVIGLKEEGINDFIETAILPSVQKEARSAKFEIGENGKVNEFEGSRPGVTVDQPEMYVALNDAMLQRFWHDEGYTDSVQLVVTQTEPEVKTGEVNNLGIKEILGVGYSNFSGSPPNRIKNIRFAAENKLNGLLIKPGEEFSMINALGPFTKEAGYLPELVIKGDEIKPEIGGGLCQIGSTMFRAAMNSGLEITQRRNHSLVVGYYNDHRNGLPGTDATIYDPAPDFRFKNDTDSYALITTEMNAYTGDLFFTIWGTSKGVKGSYTQPKVIKWIDAGETKEIKTTKLAPGERKCQGKHNGAQTSFTYVKQLKNGEKIERVFDSYYRPLPEICLVGVETLVDPKLAEEDFATST